MSFPRVAQLYDAFELGRFEGHVNASAPLLPQVAYAADISPRRVAQLGDVCAAADLRMLVLTTPRNDPILIIDVPIVGDTDVSRLIQVLATSCWERERITVDDQPILSWLAAELETAIPLRFGRNVHQCVFPSGQLGEQLLSADVDPDGTAVMEVIYRGTLSPGRGSRLGVRIPDSLRNPGETLVAHGRGVSLIVGWDRPVENILTLTAVMIVSALGVLYRARDLAFEALTHNQDIELRSTSDARELVSRLSESLNEVQLDLSFGVEAYVDGILIPELLVDSFQSSLREATGLDSGLANTSRMVERLGAVIRVRGAMLETATQDEQERRSRVLNVLLAVGSLIALPPSLLLAFFGVSSPDIDPSRSILDLGRYWAAYVVAWLPFAGLVMVGFVLRRRISGSPRLFKRSGARIPRSRVPDEPDTHQPAATAASAQS